MPLTIGAEAINRGTRKSATDTVIGTENPASVTGHLHTIEVFVDTAIPNFEVAIFEQVSANTFTTRSHQLIGNIPIGWSEHPVTLAVEVGDYLGFHGTGGRLDLDLFGDGYWTIAGDFIPCTNQLFSFVANRTISLLGHITPPPPPLLNWATLDMVYCSTITGLKVVATSDIEVHLWLRHTTVPPRKHPLPVMVRGRKMGVDIRFCFVVYEAIEQEEEGDTLIHTFYIPNLPICTWFYFYLFGTIQGYTSPSTSPIFTVHRYDPFTILIKDLWTWTPAWPYDITYNWFPLYMDDWSWYTGFAFSDTQYVSYPTSILIGDPFREVYFLSRKAGALDLKAGRITSWVMMTATGVGSPWFYIGVTGAGSSGIRLLPYKSTLAWWRTRFTWWQGKDAEGNPKTVVFRELWEDDQWTDEGITYHDPMSGSINRVGIGATPQSIGYRNRWDDTIIEKWTKEPCY